MVSKQAFSVDYGPLFPVRDQTTGLELLQLPRGFEYLSHSWRGDRMTDGLTTPGAHDGMAAFRAGDKVTRWFATTSMAASPASSPTRRTTGRQRRHQQSRV